MVISYAYYEPYDQGTQLTAFNYTGPKAPTKAGIFEVQTRYSRMDTVNKALQQDSAGVCKYPLPANNKDADAYCPHIYADPKP